MEGTFAAWVNPLQYLDVDEPWASLQKKTATVEGMVEFLTTPGLSHDIESLVARYKEISIEDPRLAIAPNEARILEKLIWPLRQAKGSYVLGNYLGTISLCGIVAEMIAILRFETGDAVVNGQPMKEDAQKRILGSSFEKLSQERRVAALLGLGIIGDETKALFDALRATRNKYLHMWSKEHDDLREDAVKAYIAAVSLVTTTIGQTFVDGRLVLTSTMIKYLTRCDAIQGMAEKSG